MAYLLQAQSQPKRVIPTVDEIKRHLEEKEDRFDEYLDHLVSMIAEYTPKIIAAIIVLFVGMWLIRRIAVLAEKAMVRKELEISLRTFLRSLVSIGLKIILIVTVAGMIGVGTASFVTILGAAGLAVGLALQGSLSNFAGGVLILIFKPFRVGDSIEAGGQTGEVIEIQIFNTILLTGEHKTVILPNGPLSNGTIVNITRHGNLRLDLSLTVSADNDLASVTNIISGVMKRHDKILPTPKPSITIGKIVDGSVTLNIRPFSLPGDAGDLTNKLYHDLKVAFEVNKIKPAIQERFIHTIG